MPTDKANTVTGQPPAAPEDYGAFGEGVLAPPTTAPPAVAPAPSAQPTPDYLTKTEDVIHGAVRGIGKAVTGDIADYAKSWIPVGAGGSAETAAVQTAWGALPPVQFVRDIEKTAPVINAYHKARRGGASIGDAIKASDDVVRQHDEYAAAIKSATDAFHANPTETTARALTDAAALAASLYVGGEEAGTELGLPRTPTTVAGEDAVFEMTKAKIKSLQDLGYPNQDITQFNSTEVQNILKGGIRYEPGTAAPEAAAKAAPAPAEAHPFDIGPKTAPAGVEVPSGMFSEVGGIERRGPGGVERRAPGEQFGRGTGPFSVAVNKGFAAARGVEAEKAAPTKVYHATGADVESIEQLDAARSHPTATAGPGVYLTREPETASAYVARTPTARVLGGAIKGEKLLDASKPLPPQIAKAQGLPEGTTYLDALTTIRNKTNDLTAAIPEIKNFQRTLATAGYHGVENIYPTRDVFTVFGNDVLPAGQQYKDLVQAALPSKEAAPKGELVEGADVAKHIMKTSTQPIDEAEARSRLGSDVGGKYRLENVPVSKLDAGDNYSPVRAKQYAQKATSLPPIVLNMDGGIKDGNHRVAAAKIRGDKTIAAYVPQTTYGPKEMVESAGGVFRGAKGGLVEITLPRAMTDKLPIQDRLKDFVSVTLPEGKVTPEAVKTAMDKKVVEMGGKPSAVVSTAMEAKTAYHPDLQKVADQYGTSTDASRVRDGASFITPDGKFIHLPGVQHPTAIESATGERPLEDKASLGEQSSQSTGPEDSRIRFLKDTGAIRTRFNIDRAGDTLHVSVPKDGVTSEHIDALKDAVRSSMPRHTGNMVMEVGEPGGKSVTRDFVTASDVEPMLREIEAHPDQKPIDLSAAYGATGRRVGDTLASRTATEDLRKIIALRRGEISPQEYTKTLGVTHGPELLEIPRHLFGPRSSTRGTLGHEVGHIVGAAQEGIPTTGAEIQSHLNPALVGTNTAAQVPFKLNTMPGASEVPAGVSFTKNGLKDALPKLIRTVVSGPVMQEILEGISFEENPSTYGDRAYLEKLRVAAGWTEDEMENEISRAVEQKRKDLNHPAILDIVRNSIATREDGLSKTLHASVAKVQDIAQKVREVQHGRTNDIAASKRDVEGNLRGDSRGAGEAVAGRPGEVSTGDTERIKPAIQGTLFAKKVKAVEDPLRRDVFTNGGWITNDGKWHIVESSDDTHLGTARRLGLTKESDANFDAGIKDAISTGAIRIKPEYAGYGERQDAISIQAPNTQAARMEIRDALAYYPHAKHEVRLEFLGQPRTHEFENVADAQEWLESPRREVSGRMFSEVEKKFPEWLRPAVPTAEDVPSHAQSIQEIPAEGEAKRVEKPDVPLSSLTDSLTREAGSVLVKAPPSEPVVNPSDAPAAVTPMPTLEARKIQGGTVSQPHPSYHEASAGQTNPWVRRSADPASRRLSRPAPKPRSNP